MCVCGCDCMDEDVRNQTKRTNERIYSNTALFVCILWGKLGFCGETEDEFNDTLEVMRQVKYHVAFMFAYSMREVSLLEFKKKHLFDLQSFFQPNVHIQIKTIVCFLFNIRKRPHIGDS